MRRFMDSRTRWYWVLRSMKSMRRDDKRTSRRPLSAVGYPLLFQQLADRLVGEPVRPLVVRHARVTLHPMPFDAVPLDLALQLLPQIDVLDGLLVCSAPVTRFPLRQPFENTFAHVLGIRVERDRARLLQRCERANRRGQLHAV